MKEMTVAIIEDNKSDFDQIKDYCFEIGKEEKITVEIICFNSIDDFKSHHEEKKPDLMIVDLRLGESNNNRSGWDIVKKIFSYEIIPVIIYSAFSEEEPEEIFKSLLIARIIKGGEEVEKFKQTLKIFIRLKLRFNQAKERIIKEFGKLSLETVKEILGEGKVKGLDERTLEMMAIGRLASYLLNVPPEGEKFLPESVFIYPPLDIPHYPRTSLFLGDFLEQKGNNESSRLWLVISPSCDLVATGERKAKISEILLLCCYKNYTEVPFLRDEQDECVRKNLLKNRIQRNTAKILKCPSRIFGNKYILISFKDYRTLFYDDIKKGINNDTWKKLATLASPYIESLQGLFIKDISRIGTPETASSEEEMQWGKEFVKNAT
ncbi:MAG: response regulator [Candidatus Marinimicrobia bacterium]|nr:response regulator [Candidatus Cloacimonadota bacterium]MCK4448397.1 response regulator [Candidatus Neomarinimicrobiota bacterium]